MGTTKIVEKSSGFSLQSSPSSKSATAGSLFTVTTANTIDDVSTTPGLPIQNDVSDVEGSVDFVDETESVFTDLTNPAAVVGLSTAAPELIASIDYIPLFKDLTIDPVTSIEESTDLCNEGIYNTIYQNVLLDSLTREAARNILVKILKNENGEVESSISRLSNISVDSHSDLLDSFASVAAYSHFVRNDILNSERSQARNLLFEIFQEIRSAMSSPSTMGLSMVSPAVESSGLPESFFNFHGFNPRRIMSVDNMYELFTGELVFSEDEFKNSSNSKLIAQVIQDIRKCVVYGSSIRDLDVDRDTSSSGFSPYTVIDDGPSGKFASVISGLDSLNSDSSSLSVSDISTLSFEDYALFLDSLDDLSFTDRIVIISQILSRDISMSFLKRTDAVLDLAKSVSESTFGSNPSVEHIIDNTVGNIGGSLFESSPGIESIASLINPETDSSGNTEKILTFEKFSIDSSFGNAISGFGAFAGDFVGEINSWILANEAMAASQFDFNWVTFCEDFYQKSETISELIPTLIGGAGASNNVFRAITDNLSSYMEANGFIHDNDTIQGAISGDLYTFLNDTGSNIELPSASDDLEFLRLAIFVLAASDPEVAHLLTVFLDIRRLVKKMEDIPSSDLSSMEFSTGQGETTTSQNEFIGMLQESYSEYYATAQALASKIFEITTSTSVSGVGGFDRWGADSASVTREYGAKRTISIETSIDAGNTDYYLFNNPDDDVGIMKTPVGLALLTSPSENCIFDLPQASLDQLYEDFVEKDIEGVSLTTNDILRLNRAVSGTTTIASSSEEDELASIADLVSESGIVTDFRGYSDNLRRRAMTYIIIDILRSMDVTKSSNQMPFQVEVTTDNYQVTSVAEGEMTLQSIEELNAEKGKSARSVSTLDVNATVDLTVDVKFNLDLARSSQICLAMTKYLGKGIYESEGMTGYEGAISRLNSSLNSVFGDQYDASIEEDIRDIHSYLIKEYTRCETLTEALHQIGSKLLNSSNDISESFESTELDTLSEFFKYADLSAANAVSNSEISSLSQEDALSAVFSTCMFYEMMGNMSLNKYSKMNISDAGFFDSDISADGVQASSIDLLIPASEIVPANILSKRILPALRFLTAPGRSQSTSDRSGKSKQDPILAVGDPDEDRMKILTVGLPVGLTTRLRDEATNYTEWHGSDSSGADTGENYENSTLINIKVYKKDLDRGDVVYKPKSFIFDTQVRPSTRAFYAGGGAKITSNIPESSGVSESINKKYGNLSYPASLAAFGDINLDGVFGAHQVAYTEHLPGVGYTGATVEASDDKFFANQISDLYDDLLFYKYDYDCTITDTLSDIFTDSADEIKRNHTQDYVLKEYLKVVAGIDVTEDAFPLFEGGCNYSSTSDGAGLGTGSSDYAFLSERDANQSLFDYNEEDPYISETYIQQARSDILSIVADIIEDEGADLETSISSNIAAKLKQSFIMSPEKYYNQANLPGLFERTFCVLVDPDGFDIDTDESAEDIATSEQRIGEYKSELFSFFVTVEILKNEDELYTR